MSLSSITDYKWLFRNILFGNSINFYGIGNSNRRPQHILEWCVYLYVHIMCVCVRVGWGVSVFAS